MSPWQPAFFKAQSAFFFRWLLCVSFGFLQVHDTQSVSWLCVQLQIWGIIKEGISYNFQRAMGQDFFGKSAHRHVLRTVSTWAFLKNFPDIFGAHMGYRLLRRSGPDNNFWFSAVSFCHFFLFLLKITGKFPWEPQNTDQRSSLLPTHAQMFFLTHHSVPKQHSTVPPVSHLRYLKTIEQNCRVSLVGKDPQESQESKPWLHTTSKMQILHLRELSKDSLNLVPCPSPSAEEPFPNTQPDPPMHSSMKVVQR